MNRAKTAARRLCDTCVHDFMRAGLNRGDHISGCGAMYEGRKLFVIVAYGDSTAELMCGMLETTVKAVGDLTTRLTTPQGKQEVT